MFGNGRGGELGQIHAYCASARQSPIAPRPGEGAEAVRSSAQHLKFQHLKDF